MYLPIERDFIDKCKQMIEDRLQWKLSSSWKKEEYESLSEIIAAKTRISISASTLKRIWHNSGSGVPHISTLNALALFLDYENWNDFKSDVKEDLNLQNKSLPKPVSKLIKVLLFIVLLAVIMVIGFIYFRKPDLEPLPVKPTAANVAFTSSITQTSGLPNSVIFNYDISAVDFDSAFIQQDRDQAKRTRIFKQNNHFTGIYYYPGYYTASIVLNDSVIREHSLFITTDGWMAVYKKKYNQEIPVYIRNINPVKNHRLYVSPDDLKANQIENDKDFLIGLYNTRDFGNIAADTFTYETVVKNSISDGALTCQYASLTVQAQKGVLTSSFSEKGCTSKIFYTFGEVNGNGSDMDLSAFATDMSKWHKIKYKVIAQNVHIYLDDREIHQVQFKRKLGKIIGLSYHFYGCGSVKEAKLWDSHDNLVYQEKF